MLPQRHLEAEGRLHYELGVRKQETLTIVLGCAHKAAMVMGIGLDGERSAMAVREALKKILEVYPSAWVQDICKSIEMASFGQIKLADQLNTISAANIFNWYREMRINHPDKISEPVSKTHMEEEIPNNRKIAIMVNAFNEFLTNKSQDEQWQTMYYERLVKLGYIQLSPEQKIKLMIDRIEPMLQAYPKEILFDGVIRRAANRFRDYYRELPEPKKVNWSEWADNPIINLAKGQIQAALVRQVLQNHSADELMTNYKNQINNEYQNELS